MLVQQRRQFNQERQQWEMVSRVYREQWIRLLKLVNEHIYPPKHRRMLPQPIVAQYEYPIPPKPLSYTQNFGKVINILYIPQFRPSQRLKKFLTNINSKRAVEQK